MFQQKIAGKSLNGVNRWFLFLFCLLLMNHAFAREGQIDIDGKNHVLRQLVIPVITLIEPRDGETRGHQHVTIFGTGFSNLIDVTFDYIPAIVILSVTDTRIELLTPPHHPGLAMVRIRTPEGESIPDERSFYFYHESPIFIEQMIPDEGPTSGGTHVTIFGFEFFDVKDVLFDGIPAQIVHWDPSRIEVITPPHSEGPVQVQIVTPFGISQPTPQSIYTYIAPVANPMIFSITPNIGDVMGGDTVVIMGAGFARLNTVLFDTSPATILSFTDTDIVVLTPPHAAGQVNVTVETAAGVSVPTSESVYTYTATPVITAILPPSGDVAGGNLVVIEGGGFVGLIEVLFDGVPASVVVASDNLIEVIAPPHTIGSINVAVVTATGTSNPTSASVYTYTNAPILVPTITNLDPPQGPVSGGNAVIITGTNFAGTLEVLFDDIPAIFTVISNTEIRAVAPPGAVGTVNVTVINASGATFPSGASLYQYVDTSTAPSPPSHFKGKAAKNVFLSQTDYINRLKWKASSDASVVGYQITRNGHVIAKLPATALCYEDHNRRKKGTDTYLLQAFNSQGALSESVRLVMKRK